MAVVTQRNAKGSKMESFEPYTLTLKQVANALHISRTTLWRRIQEGELQTVELGGRRLITPQALNAYIKHLETDPPTLVNSSMSGGAE